LFDDPRPSHHPSPSPTLRTKITIAIKYPLVNVNKKLLKMAIEIVDFPMKNGDFPDRYVKLPEG
jgi:hypothetical protein